MSQTRQERRRAERAAKKEGEQFKMHFELWQPWSTFIMKTQLPPPILEKMIRITDKIVDNVENEISHGEHLAGQIKDELWVDHDILVKEEVMDFFLDVSRNFVKHRIWILNKFHFHCFSIVNMKSSLVVIITPCDLVGISKIRNISCSRTMMKVSRKDSLKGLEH